MRKMVLPFLIILLALVLVAFGLARGETGEIHSAGSAVCMECVGLG